jgi:hypothetical protein
MYSYLINILDVGLNFISKNLKINLVFLFKKIKAQKNDSFLLIDVVIPLIVKDLNTVEKCIEGLKKHSLNPIRNIYIISPNDQKIIDFTKQNKVIFINEDLVSDISTIEIINYLRDDKLIGWLKQQIIKLSVDNIIDIGNNVLLMDSDTILCKDQFFVSDKYSILLTRYNEILVTENYKKFTAINGRWPKSCPIELYRINTQNPNGIYFSHTLFPEFNLE